MEPYLKHLTEYVISIQLLALGVVSYLFRGLLSLPSALNTWLMIFGAGNITLLNLKKTAYWRTAIFVELLAVPLLASQDDQVASVSPYLLLPCCLMAIYFTKPFKLAVLHSIIQAVICYKIVIPRHISTLKKDFGQEHYQSALANMLVSFFVLVVIFSFEWQREQHNTKIKKLQEDISSANIELSAKKSELERALENEEIFLLTFSHELKNSLNGLLGNLSLAIECAVDLEVFGYLKQAKVCGHILRNFILNILDTGKIEKSSLEVVYERTDATEWLSKLWTVTGELIRNKRLQGFMKISKNLPRFLLIDQQRLFQIILNLTSNAVKFTNEGHVYFIVDWEDQPDSPQIGSLELLGSHGSSSLELKQESDCDLNSENVDAAETECFSLKQIPQSPLKKSLKDSFWKLDFKSKTLENDALFPQQNEGSTGFLKISVIDTGCGMDPSQTAKLFNKFSQVGSEAQQKIGTGLGLWISKKLAEKMNGTISVKSRPGIGSVFEVRLQVSVLAGFPLVNRISSFVPTKKIDLKNLLQGGVDSTCNPLSPGSWNKKKILVADDDVFNVDLMGNYLRKLNCEYIVAYNGEELVDQVKKNYDDISVILTDNHMPKMDGITAIREIQKYLSSELKPMLPVYLVSGDHRVGDEAFLRSLDIKKLLSKPLEFQSFKEIIQNHFEGYQ